MLFWGVNIVLWIIIAVVMARIGHIDKQNFNDSEQKEEIKFFFSPTADKQKRNRRYCRNHQKTDLEDYF